MSDLKFVDKIWGKTAVVESSDIYSKHYLETLAGGYCSIHHHRYRYNIFNVISGKFEIIEYVGRFARITELFPGDTYEVAPMINHMFKSLTDGSMVEEYYCDEGYMVFDDDIIRITEGGISCD